MIEVHTGIDPVNGPYKVENEHHHLLFTHLQDGFHLSVRAVMDGHVSFWVRNSHELTLITLNSKEVEYLIQFLIDHPHQEEG